MDVSEGFVINILAVQLLGFIPIYFIWFHLFVVKNYNFIGFIKRYILLKLMQQNKNKT